MCSFGLDVMRIAFSCPKYKIYPHAASQSCPTVTVVIVSVQMFFPGCDCTPNVRRRACNKERKENWHDSCTFERKRRKFRKPLPFPDTDVEHARFGAESTTTKGCFYVFPPSNALRVSALGVFPATELRPPYMLGSLEYRVCAFKSLPKGEQKKKCRLH